MEKSLRSQDDPHTEAAPPKRKTRIIKKFKNLSRHITTRKGKEAPASPAAVPRQARPSRRAICRGGRPGTRGAVAALRRVPWQNRVPRLESGDNKAPASAGDVNIGGAVIQLAAGGNGTCALLATGAVRCRGTGNGGRLGCGNANIGDNQAPAAAGDVVIAP
jgi:hypothetical protein